MTPLVALCPVVRKRSLGPRLYDITVEHAEMAARALPGQFVHIRCEGVLLRRPISICEIEGTTLRLLVEERGAGTAWLAGVHEGAVLDILGPLGHGFALGDTARPVVFVGGGIGVFPLLAACKPFGANATVLLGFRTASLITLDNDFAASGADLRLATDDGSCGTPGTVCTLLQQRLAEGPCAAIFACGPRPMLQATAMLAAQHGIPCQVSMEERMGCGVGACLVCACKTRRADGSESYAHVCKDGPVFDAAEVIW